MVLLALLLADDRPLIELLVDLARLLNVFNRFEAELIPLRVLFLPTPLSALDNDLTDLVPEIETLIRLDLTLLNAVFSDFTNLALLAETAILAVCLPDTALIAAAKLLTELNPLTLALTEVLSLRVVVVLLLEPLDDLEDEELRLVVLDFLLVYFGSFDSRYFFNHDFETETIFPVDLPPVKKLESRYSMFFLVVVDFFDSRSFFSRLRFVFS